MSYLPASTKAIVFPAEIISHCVWLYFRFCLSYRDVEEMMVERGIAVSYESVGEWCLKFGGAYAKRERAFGPEVRGVEAFALSRTRPWASGTEFSLPMIHLNCTASRESHVVIKIEFPINLGSCADSEHYDACFSYPLDRSLPSWEGVLDPEGFL